MNDCVICLDNLLNPSHSHDVFATLCGHIFHHACLMQWLGRSKSCPECRRECSEGNVHKIYIGAIQQQFIQKEIELKKSADEIDTLKVSRNQYMETVSILEKEVASLVCSYEEQIEGLAAENRAFDELRQENMELKTKSIELTDILKATQNDMESQQKLKEDTVSDFEGETASLICSYEEQLKSLKAENRALDELRKENMELKTKSDELRDTLKATENDLRREQKLKESLQEKNSWLKRADRSAELLETLRVENRALDELRKENNDLKTKSNLMNKIQDVLTSTQSEVESMIRDNPDIKTLSVLLVTMKREVKIFENEKNELRDTLKSTLNDLQREQKLKESLLEKTSWLKRAVCSYEDQIKSLKAQNRALDELRKENMELKTKCNELDTLKAAENNMRREKKT